MNKIGFKEIVRDASLRGYAVPMFDVSNPTMIRAAAETADEMRSPVILAALLPDIEGGLLGYWIDAAKRAVANAKAPVSVFLDHSPDAANCRRCVDAGFDGVMLDASSKPFDENVALTREVVEYAKSRGVGVEAELGHVAKGIVGESDRLKDGGEENDTETVFTDPSRAADFVEKTGVDALAVSIGTTHGVYVAAPKLDVLLCRRIHEAVSVPLVMHGGSGTPDDQVKESVKAGIAKVNIYSELTSAWNTAMRDYLVERGQMTCWMSVVIKKPYEALKAKMREKMEMLGSVGRA